MHNKINKILIDNLKCKIIFLFTGAKNIEVKYIPRKYRAELRQLNNELQEYISPKEYQEFLANCLDIDIRDPADTDIKGPVEQAEDIIKKRGQSNG